MQLRPGSNSPATTHLTDATSGGAAGYGSYVDPRYTNSLQNYINALPSVAAARMALTSQGGQSYDQMRQAIQSTLVNFGDPTAFGGAGQSLASLFGGAVDPATAALARANTVGANGSYGNSIVAQLKQAASAALQQKLQAIGGSGFQSSGGAGAEINQSNIGLGHDVYNAAQQALGTVTGAINSNNNTQLQLQQALQNAILKGTQTVEQHPDLYPIPRPTVNTIGGGTPTSPVGRSASPYPQTNPNTFTPGPGGPGVRPTNTGAIPLPKPPTPKIAAPAFNYTPAGTHPF